MYRCHFYTTFFSYGLMVWAIPLQAMKKLPVDNTNQSKTALSTDKSLVQDAHHYNFNKKKDQDGFDVNLNDNDWGPLEIDNGVNPSRIQSGKNSSIKLEKLQADINQRQSKQEEADQLQEEGQSTKREIPGQIALWHKAQILKKQIGNNNSTNSLTARQQN